MLTFNHGLLWCHRQCSDCDLTGISGEGHFASHSNSCYDVMRSLLAGVREVGAKSKVAVRELVIFGLFLGVSLSACTPRAGLFPALESDTPSTVATPQTDQPP